MGFILHPDEFQFLLGYDNKVVGNREINFEVSDMFLLNIFDFWNRTSS